MNWMKQIELDWTLFLDRDGVINYESQDDYIMDWNTFRFLPGSIETFSIFGQLFKKVFIVTNQKGVGKGLMSEDDLIVIHKKLSSAVENAGGSIAKIYYCTALEDEDPCRKPNNGMALMAKKDFPEIEFHKSIMVGNTMSDMQFGKSCGMFTVFIRSEKPGPASVDPLIDLVFSDLSSFAKALQKSVSTK